MATLQSVLAGIPGLAGYEAARQQNEARGMQELQQATSLAQLLGAVQQQKQREAAMQKEAAAQAAFQALGPNPSEDAIQQWAAQHAGPQKVLDVLTKSRDRNATIKAAEIKAEADRKQRLHEIQLRGQEKLDQIEALAREQRITRQEADQRARETRAEMIRLFAENRAPRETPAPVAVVGPDGKPVYVRRDEAFGKTPAPTGASGQKPQMDVAELSSIIDKSAGELIDLIDKNPKSAASIFSAPARGIEAVTGAFADRETPGLNATNAKQRLIFAVDQLVKQGKSSNEFLQRLESAMGMSAITTPTSAREALNEVVALSKSLAAAKGGAGKPGVYVEIRVTPTGKRLGKKADGTIEEIKSGP